MRATIAFLMLAVLMTSARIARAEKGALIVAGTVNDRDQALAEKSMSAALAKAGWTLPDKPLSKTESNAVMRCFKSTETHRCVLGVLQSKGIQSVVYVSVNADTDKAGVLKLSGRIVSASIDYVLVRNRFCDHCTDDTLASNAAELTRNLLDGVSIANGRTVLAVRTSPQGARYSLDGEWVGVTDALIYVTPGPHTVIVEQDGFETATRTVEAKEGTTAEVSITMNRTKSDGTAAQENTHNADASTQVPDDEPRRPFAAKALLVGGGVALVAGGVALFLDQDSRTVPKDQDQHRYYYDTTTAGMALIAAGAVATGVGAYLYWGRRSSSTSAAVVPTANGAVMTLNGTF